MTLVEFIAPLSSSTHRDRILAVLYFKKHVEQIDAATASEIRDWLKSARAKRWSAVNVSSELNRAGHYVDFSNSGGQSRAWSLTQSGDEYVRNKLGLEIPKPEIKHDSSQLSNLVASLTDAEVRDYFEEAIDCLEAGALRATVVFIWSGTIRTLQRRMIKIGKKPLNNAVQKHDQKARSISSVDHFAYIKDKVTLLAAVDLGLLDKSEKDTLKEALDLRNRCGHPGKYKPGIKKVSSFVEDILSIVYP